MKSSQKYAAKMTGDSKRAHHLQLIAVRDYAVEFE